MHPLGLVTGGRPDECESISVAAPAEHPGVERPFRARYPSASHPRDIAHDEALFRAVGREIHVAHDDGIAQQGTGPPPKTSSSQGGPPQGAPPATLFARRAARARGSVKMAR